MYNSLYIYISAALNPDTIRRHKDDIWNSLDDVRRDTYGQEYLDHLYTELEVSSHKLPNDLSPVVRAVRSALLSKHPLTHYPVGVGARTVIYLLTLLPTWMADKFTSLIAISVHDIRPAAMNT